MNTETLGFRAYISQDWECHAVRGVKSVITRSCTSAGFLAVVMFRFSGWLYARKWRLLARLAWRLNATVNGCDLAPTATIGPGLRLPHPFGTVVGNRVVAGRDLVLYQGVTLGGRAADLQSQMDSQALAYPRIGNGVVLYPYAQVLGGIRVGDRAVALAHAVVVKDVPEGVVVAGVPARVLEQERAETEGE